MQNRGLNAVWKPQNRWEWLLGGASLFVVVLLFLSHNYFDILVTARHGINFWSILFQGDILHFYSENTIASGNIYYNEECACVYNILIYLIFAVWNIPLALLMHFTSIDVMNSIPCLIWIKLLPQIFMVLSTILLKKIMDELQVDEQVQRLSLYAYVFSSISLSCLLTIAQYDIISVTFQLLGVLAFIRGKKQKFVFWFSIAFCCKFFAFFLFLPLLLLQEKRIERLLHNAILFLIPYLVTTLPFSFAERANGGINSIVLHLFPRVFWGAEVTANLFYLFYTSLIVYCYLKCPTTHELSRFAVYASFGAMVLFVGCLGLSVYWIILVAPYFTLFMALCPQNREVNLILETVGYASLVISKMVSYPAAYWGSTLKPMIWSILAPERVAEHTGRIYTLFYGLSNMGSNEVFQSMLRTIFLSAMGLIMILAYWNQNGERFGEYNNIYHILSIRFIVVSVLTLLPVISLFV